MATVLCDRLGRDFGHAVTALDDVSLALTPGVTALVGVNGAGKSTLLRVLAGALRPTRGTVRVDGHDPYGRTRRAALTMTALMPQSLDLPTDARVRDAVAYRGWLRGMSMRASRAAAVRALDDVGLSERATSSVRTLSGGMIRRLALAQAIASEPTLLLLDEPTTGLDPEQRVGVRNLVAGLPRDGVTVVSSHVMEDLETLADRIIVLDAGRVVFTGALDDFRSKHGGPGRSAEHAFLSLITSHRRAS